MREIVKYLYENALLKLDQAPFSAQALRIFALVKCLSVLLF